MNDDINELKKRIEELENQNDLYKFIMDQLPVGIQIFDKKGLSFSMNEKQKVLLGLPNKSIGVGEFNVLTDDYSVKNGAAAIYKKAYKGEKYEHKYSYNLGVEDNKWNTRKDVRLFHEKILPFKNKNKDVDFVIAILKDITEIDQLNINIDKKFLTKEKELHKKQNQLKTAQRIAQIGSWYWDLKTDNLIWSDEEYRIFEQDFDKKFTNSQFFDFVHPNYKKIVKKARKNLLKDDKFELEFKVIVNGKEKWVYEIAETSFDKNGEPVYVSGISQDITHQKKIEQAYIKNLSKFRLLFEQSPIGIYIADIKGNILDGNKKLIELLGSPSLEATKKINVLQFTPLVKNGYADIFKKCIKTKENQYLEIEYTSKWGRTIILSSHIVPLLSKNNEVEQVYTLMEDISKRKKYEKALQESEQRYKDFVNHSPDIIYTFSSTRGALFWSDRVTEILEYAPDELMDNPFIWYESIHPNDQTSVNEAIENYYKGEDYSLEYQIKTKSGKWIWLHDYFMYKKIIGEEIIIEGHAADITQRKHLEIKLAASKQRFDLAMNATQDGLWDWNLKTNEIYFSPMWKSMLGYENNELDNNFSVWEKLTHDEDRKKALKQLDKHFNKETERLDVEFRMKHKNGKWINILSRGHALFNNKGKAYRMVGTHVDITERKKIKQQLEDSELRWKFAIEGNKDGLWDWNLISNKVFFSKNWKKMLGYEVHEIEDSLKEWDKRVHPDDKEEVYQDINNYLNGKTTFYSNEHRVICKDGNYKWILDRGIIIERTPEGVPKRMIGTHHDITERKLAEQKIKESQAKFKTVFDIVEVGILITDHKGNMIDCNRASEKILNIDKTSILQKNHNDLDWNTIRTDGSIMPPNEFASVIALKENKIVKDIEIGLKNSRGIKWISASASPVKMKNYGVVIAFIDITKKKRYRKKLEELNATKDKFFSIIAHDLRSPFNAILGFSELAITNLEDNSYDKLEKYCNLIYKTANQSFDLLNNLLQWARFQTNRIEFKPKPIKLFDLVKLIFDLLEANLQSKSISYKIDVEKSIFCYADQFMLETIFRNLISNAIKYTYDNGEIVVKASKENNVAFIKVCDNGIGISKEHINELFKIENNHSASGTHNEKGTGLGLILCKEFVERHKGKIWVESELNKGTQFNFTLLDNP